MRRGKQSVKKGVWYTGEKNRKQKDGAMAIGLLASIGAPILGEISKPILVKIFGRGKERWRKGLRQRRWEKN